MIALHSPQGILARFILGCSAIALGWFMIPNSTSTDAPELTESSQAPNPDKTIDDPIQQTRFRLSYQQEDGMWMVTPMGATNQLLTNLIPGPRNREIPSGYMEPQAISQLLSSVISDWNLHFNDDERNQLLTLKLGDETLFQPHHLEPNPTTAKANPQPEKVEVIVEQTPPVSEKPTSDPIGPWVWNLTHTINPTSPNFQKDMLQWQDTLKPLLRVNAARKGNVNFNVPLTDGKTLRLTMGTKARTQLNRADFGSSRSDAALYLQFLARKRGADLALDGAFGPGSLKQWRGLLARESLAPGDLDAYMNFLSSYFGEEIPPILMPGTKTFEKHLISWGDWLRPRLKDGRLTYHSPFQGKNISLNLTSVARARILSANFGSRPKDGAIFLQFLGNHFGEPMTLDGNLGPKSRKALGQMLSKSFNRPHQHDTYIQSLQTSYP